MKNFDGPREIEIWIRRPQRGHGHRPGFAPHHNRRSSRGSQRRTVFAVHEKGQLALARLLDSRHPRDFDCAIAFEFALQFPG